VPTRSWKDLLSDAGDGGGTYDALPEGDYDLVVKEAEATTAKSSGRKMYAAKFAVQGGPHNGRLIWHNFVLMEDNPNALGYFFRNMNAIGLNSAFFETDPAEHQVAAALIGRSFRGQVVIKKYQGQDRNEVKAFFPAVGSSVGGPPPGLAAAPPAYAAPPPVAQPAPAPPPAAPPAPAPIVQAPAPAPVAEAPAVQVQAAPVAPPPPPPAAPAPAPAPAPAVAEAPPAPPAPVAEPVNAGAASNDAPPPPPPF